MENAVVVNGLIDSGDDESQPVDFGIRKNQLVKIWGVHWTVSAYDANSSPLIWVCALSSDPTHLDTPPSAIEIIGSQATYAVNNWVKRSNGVNFSTELNTVNIPLYGLLRPRRQIVCFSNTVLTNVRMRCEIYYEIVEGSQVEVDAVNVKYGKYRRE